MEGDHPFKIFEYNIGEMISFLYFYDADDKVCLMSYHTFTNRHVPIILKAVHNEIIARIIYSWHVNV